MNQLAKEISAEVMELISRYGFDLDGYSVKALVDYWMQQYPASWIRLATIEALYQGRYKAISIEQILNLWRRRTRPVYHFNGEFERMISLRPMLNAAIPASSTSTVENKPTALSATAPGANQPDRLPEEAASDSSEIVQAETEAIAQAFSPVQHEADPAEWYSLSGSLQSSSAFPSIDSEASRRTIAIEPPSINQFIPTLEVSDFYWRLKAVMQSMGTGTAEEIGRRN